VKISRVSLFFFIVSFNYIFLRAVLFPLIYDNYGTNGNIYILLIIGVMILLFLLLPKSFYQMDFNSKYNTSKIRWLINPILMLRVILGIGTATMVLNELFFFDYKYAVILSGILLVTILISTLKSNEIIQVSTLFGIAVMLGYFLFLFNYIDLDFSLITKGFSFRLDTILIALIITSVLDNLYLFISNKEGINLSKKLLLVGLLCSFVLFSFEYGILTLSSGAEMFKANQLVGFEALGIEPVSRHNGNFDFIYILMIVVAVVFKFAYFMSIIKGSFKKEPKRIYYFILYVCLFVFTLIAHQLLRLHELATIYSVLILFSFGFILLLWMIKVIINAKKV